MKTKVKILILSLFLVLACKDSKNVLPQRMVSEYASITTQAARPPSRDFKTGIGIFNRDKKFIKEAHLSYQVEAMDTAVKNTKGLLNSFGGYISNEREGSRGSIIETHLTIKVPAKTFESFLDTLTKLTGEYESRSISQRDVTEEYIDTETRLENKRQLENKYRDLLKKAAKVEDLLAIEENLGKVREEIESAEKRFANLNTDIDYSKITVQFFKKTNRIDSHYSNNMIDEIWHSLKRGWYGMISSLLFVFSIWPIILIVIVVFYLAKRYRKKIKMQK